MTDHSCSVMILFASQLACVKAVKKNSYKSRNTLAKYESCEAKKGSVFKISLIIAVLYESCDGTQILGIKDVMEHS